MLVITIHEWDCGTVFYIDEDDKATCPRCSAPAVRCGKISFVVRDGEFEGLMDELIAQECDEGCWVREDGVTKENIEEVEAIIGECAIAKLRKALYGNGCPVKGA